jgi:mannose/fructose/N-acetylgalactosamine-specific phosphotransferase system component IIC
MNWFALAVIGGVVGLDATSFPQIMLSRPLVAAMLGGLAAGRPALGTAVGAIVEAFHLAVLPIGAARYPEAGTAAVAAAFALVAAGTGTGPAGLLFTLAFALAWGRVAAGSVEMTRRVNERLVAPAAPDMSDAAVEARQMTTMAIDFVRGSLVTVAGAAIGAVLLRIGHGLGEAHPVVAQGGLAILLCGATAGALSVFGGIHERKAAFLAGAVVGALLLFVR